MDETKAGAMEYVNNQQLIDEILLYQTKAKEAEAEGKRPPQIPDSIGRMIERIASGVASRPNFRRYTYIDEMTRDAIVDCVRAVRLFDINKLGKSGKPNAFGYFSRIIWYAFLTRISSEKKAHEGKIKMMFDPTTISFDTNDGDETLFQDTRNEILDFYYSGKL